MRGITWTGVRETPVPSAARNTSGTQSLNADYGAAHTIRAQLNVTAASGSTPTLAVIVEDSVDDGATWNTVITFTSATGVTREVKDYTGLFGPILRVRWTVGGGTPSFTFQVDWVVEQAAQG